MSKIDVEFYRSSDVVAIARELLGKYIFTNIDNELTAGIVTETEAYEGATDKASHAYNNRRTSRTEIMFAAGGVSYVYLCYGIHSLFNIITNKENIPHAVLVRGIKPVEGIEIMLRRRKKKAPDKTLASGPGSMAQALGIKTLHSGISLIGNTIWLEDHNLNISSKDIETSTRIGIDYAGLDALLPYRFILNNL